MIIEKKNEISEQFVRNHQVNSFRRLMRILGNIFGADDFTNHEQKPYPAFYHTHTHRDIEVWLEHIIKRSGEKLTVSWYCKANRGFVGSSFRDRQIVKIWEFFFFVIIMIVVITRFFLRVGTPPPPLLGLIICLRQQLLQLKEFRITKSR